ncbi:MAG: Thivi_2564 family membrane protein [Acidobacteriaceae bacterium]
MPLMNVVITLVIVGVLLWLVNSFIPMQSTIKGILNGLVTIVVIIWLVNAFGLMHYVTHFRVGH